MARTVLAGAAMGGVFFLIPAILLLGALAWIVARLLKGEKASLAVRLGVALRSAREPLETAVVLILVGAVLAGFLAGDLGPRTYFRIGLSTTVFLVESLTDWRGAGTSESIALRGFAFIIMASCAIVTFSMWRYFTARWSRADEAVAQRDKRSRLGLSRRR